MVQIARFAHWDGLSPPLNQTLGIRHMEWILSIATILGGISAIWFLYDKRHAISASFKLRVSASINPLGIHDKDFEFLVARREALLTAPYLPIDANEEATCRSLVNNGVLVKTNKKVPT